MTRFIGVSHRVKIISQKGEPAQDRPTLVCVRDGEEAKTYELTTETDELDFLLGRFPTHHRKVEDEDNLSEIAPHQITWRKVKKGEDVSDLPPSHLKSSFVKLAKGEANSVAVKIPDEWDGLRSGDKIAFILSGSGNRLAYAGSRRAEEIGAKAYHIPGFVIQNLRREGYIRQDHKLICKYLEDFPEKCYRLNPQSRKLVTLRLAYKARAKAKDARVAAIQRLRARYKGEIFCNPEGKYPEGEIELVYEEAEVNDKILQALLVEERKCDRELEKAAQDTEVYQKFCVPIEGMGPAIAGRLVKNIGDILRFSTVAKFKAYCGVHVLKDGRFPRRRSGGPNNWNPDCQQAFYLLGDQLNRRPGTLWGNKLREYKQKFRAKHPFPVLVVENEKKEILYELRPGSFTHNSKTGVYTIQTGDGKIEMQGTRRYTDAHIHRMATWRTLTKFAEWLYREWWRLECGRIQKSDGEEVL